MDDIRPVLRSTPPFGEVISLTFSGMPIGNRGVFDIDVDIADRYGLLECVGLAIRSVNGQRVDGDLLRRVKVAELIRIAATWLEESGSADAIADDMVPPRLDAPMAYVNRFTGELVAPSMTPAEHEIAMARREREVVEPAKKEAAAFRRMVREASRAGGDTRLRAAALIYQRAVRGGKNPTQAVQRELGLKSYDAAASLVRRCRAADPPLLPKTSRGRVAAIPPRQGGNLSGES